MTSRPGKAFPAPRRTLLAALTLSLVAVPLAACGGGDDAGSAAEDTPFTKDVSGELSVWGFDNADDVGKARLAFAGRAAGRRHDRPRRHRLRRAEVHDPRRERQTLPDVVQMDRQFVATYAAQDLIMPLDACFSRVRRRPARRTGTRRWWTTSRYKDEVWAVPQFFQPPRSCSTPASSTEAGVTADRRSTPRSPTSCSTPAKKMTVTEGGNPTRARLRRRAPPGRPPLWMLGFGGQARRRRRVSRRSTTRTTPRRSTSSSSSTTRRAATRRCKSFIDAFDIFGESNQFVKDQVGAQIDAQWYVNVLSPYARRGRDLGACPSRTRTGQPFAGRRRDRRS